MTDTPPEMVDKATNLQFPAVDKASEMQGQDSADLLARLEEHCDQSDSACYGVLSTGFVRMFVRDIRDALAARPAAVAVEPTKPLTSAEMDTIASNAHIAYCLGKFTSYDVALIRGVEAALTKEQP